MLIRKVQLRKEFKQEFVNVKYIQRTKVMFYSWGKEGKLGEAIATYGRKPP